MVVAGFEGFVNKAECADLCILTGAYRGGAIDLAPKGIKFDD